MLVSVSDTIAAVASPAGSAERGIIRISGPQAVSVVADWLSNQSPSQNDRPQGQLKDGISGMLRQVRQATRYPTDLAVTLFSEQATIPAAILVWPDQRSFTGQPMIEIHTVGATPILDAVLQDLLRQKIRPAERGEFTLRAFLNGRLDLVQAEAVLGVIDAADHEELETALVQLGGAVTDAFQVTRDTILALLGDLEAGLDFVEEDIQFVSRSDLIFRLTDCQHRLTALQDQATARLPSGHRQSVVLAGLPNAGKSTLFNAISRSSRAIVSSVPGTTTDYLRTTVSWGSLTFDLTDTAGVEQAESDVMRQAENLRTGTLQQADLIVWCEAANIARDEQQHSRSLLNSLTQLPGRILLVITKADLIATQDSRDFDVPDEAVVVSAHESPSDDSTVPVLLDAICSTLETDQSSRSELLSSTAVRCQDSLNRTLSCLNAAIAAGRDQVGDEIVAMELREALHELGVILGEVYTDDILDHIFSNFCIGK